MGLFESDEKITVSMEQYEQQWLQIVSVVVEQEIDEVTLK